MVVVALQQVPRLVPRQLVPPRAQVEWEEAFPQVLKQAREQEPVGCSKQEVRFRALVPIQRLVLPQELGKEP